MSPVGPFCRQRPRYLHFSSRTKFKADSIIDEVDWFTLFLAGFDQEGFYYDWYTGTFNNYGPPDPQGGNSSGTGVARIDSRSLNFLQRAQLYAAQTYANLTGWTIGFGVGADAGAGAGPKGTSWNIGLGGSASTMIVADGSGNAGFLNSVSGGVAGIKMQSAGSWFGAGFAAGPLVLLSPRSINAIKGQSGSISGGGGAVLGAGASISTSGAVTVTFGLGACAEAGISPQFGPSQFIPFCHK